jgi:uncharacterized membrane protein YqjE
VNDRRVYFFLAAAALSALVYPLTPDEYRWLAATVAVTYVVFAVLYALASISADRNGRRNGHT